MDTEDMPQSKKAKREADIVSQNEFEMCTTLRTQSPETLPLDIAPGTLPFELPSETIPSVDLKSETLPSETPPSETLPSETVPSETASSETLQSGPLPSETLPSRTLPTADESEKMAPPSDIQIEPNATTSDVKRETAIPLLYSKREPNTAALDIQREPNAPGLGIDSVESIQPLNIEIEQHTPHLNLQHEQTSSASNEQGIINQANQAANEQVILNPDNPAVREQSIPNPANQAVNEQAILNPANEAASGQCILNPANQAVSGQGIPNPPNPALSEQGIHSPATQSVADDNDDLKVFRYYLKASCGASLEDCSLDLRNSVGQSPLDLARQLKDVKAFDRLKQAGFQSRLDKELTADHPDNITVSQILNTAKYGCVDFMNEVLCNLDVDVDITNIEGKSALVLAIEQWKDVAASILTEVGRQETRTVKTEKIRNM